MLGSFAFLGKILGKTKTFLGKILGSFANLWISCIKLLKGLAKRKSLSKTDIIYEIKV